MTNFAIDSTRVENWGELEQSPRRNSWAGLCWAGAATRPEEYSIPSSTSTFIHFHSHTLLAIKRQMKSVQEMANWGEAKWQSQYDFIRVYSVCSQCNQGKYPVTSWLIPSSNLAENQLKQTEGIDNLRNFHLICRKFTNEISLLAM